MARSLAQKHQVIAATPYSLTALIRHDLEPDEEQWFARCQADYLRNFPVAHLELLRASILLVLVMPFVDRAESIPAITAWVIVAVVCIYAYRRELRLEDDRLVLRLRARIITLRAIWWGMMLAWGLAALPAGAREPFMAFGIVTMMIDGLSALAMPKIALASSLAAGFGITIGLFLGEGWQAAPIAVSILVLASFMHWSLFNLYYMFMTRRVRTRRLSQSNETIRLLLNQYDDEGSDWLYETDASLRIRNPSQRFCQASGLSHETLDGLPVTQLVGGSSQSGELIRHFEHEHAFRNAVVPVLADGKERWWSMNGRPVHGSNGEITGWRGFIADITTARRAEAQVAFLAHYDSITQLPNRALFNATLEGALTRGAEDHLTGLLYIDLDHFKAINDSYGHDVGDRLLVLVARRLEEVVRRRDMVARLGGDEFAVLMPEMDSPDDAVAVARRIIDAIGGGVEVDGQLMPIGASIGIAMAPQDADTSEVLVRSADLAMYQAKSRGRGGIVLFDPEMQTQMAERRALEFDLRAAIARQELELHFQPLLDISTRIVVGYEALLRWNHGTRGTITPDVFIPIAEDTGVIVEIGQWVIRAALAAAASWPEHLTIAVNLSPAQMRDEGLLAVVMNALGSSGVNPRRLELEITESLLMQDSEEVLDVLHRLRALGVRIALDDFGTGYSSLNYLRSFPFDKIKIDRCFVSELPAREDCQAIVRSVIALASDLNMTTTAEGVESDEQLASLLENGCQQVQGFLFSPGIPSASLPWNQGQDSAEAPAPPRPLPAAEETDPADPHHLRRAG